MNYKIEKKDTRLTCHMNGHFSFGDNAGFRLILEKIQQDVPKEVIFDLSTLSSIDSAGLGMLLMASDQSSDQGWMMMITGAAGDVLKMLKLTHVDQIVKIV